MFLQFCLFAIEIPSPVVQQPEASSTHSRVIHCSPFATAKQLGQSTESLKHLPRIRLLSFPLPLRLLQPLAKSPKHMACSPICAVCPSAMSRPCSTSLPLPTNTGCRVRADICRLPRLYQAVPYATRSQTSTSAALRRSLQPSSHSAILPEDQMLVVADGVACLLQEASLNGISSIADSRTTGYSCGMLKRRRILSSVADGFRGLVNGSSLQLSRLDGIHMWCVC